MIETRFTLTYAYVKLAFIISWHWHRWHMWIPIYLNRYTLSWRWKMSMKTFFLVVKQAPKAWYNELKVFLLSYNFAHPRSDASIFIYHQNVVTLYFSVYVDDLIITGNDNKFLTRFLQALAARFSIKDLGDLYYFISVEVLPTPSELLLTQIHSWLIGANKNLWC